MPPYRGSLYQLPGQHGDIKLPAVVLEEHSGSRVSPFLHWGCITTQLLPDLASAPSPPQV